jgi:aspartate carbamoyltransferase regulatory subunit
LVKAKFYGENINLTVYPEWMIKLGEFGNLDGSKSIQLALSDNTFTSNAQSIELLNDNNDSKNYTRSVSIISDDFYSKPLEYTASETFPQYDYTQQGYDRDFVQKYKTAGYVRITDAQHTAFDVTDILNLNVNEINNKDLIWIAKKSNNDWDIQRITYTGLNIITIKPINNNTQIILGFNGVHNLTVNQYIAISNSQFPILNKVYQVKEIIDSTSVLVNFANASTISRSFTTADQSTVATYGNLYRFVSVRLPSLDNVNSVLPYNEYQTADTVNQLPGDKIFVDNEGSNWKIYEKVDPYKTFRIGSPDTDNNQEFGYKTIARSDGKFLIISAPGSRGATSQGTVYFFSRGENDSGSAFSLTNSYTMSDSTTGTGRLGHSLSMSTDENFVAAGAPYANILTSDGSTRRNNSGLIKLFIWDTVTKAYNEFTTIKPADDSSSANINFGWSHALAEPTIDSDKTVRQKYLLVGAPGYASDTGIVYLYTYTPVEDSTFAAWTQDNSVVSSQAGINKRFGHRMAINDNGDILAVSSVSPDDAGMVEIFVRTSPSNNDSTMLGFTHVQTLKGVSADDSTLNTAFGEDLSMSKDGLTLVISAPGRDNFSQADAGAVYIYKWNADGSTFEISTNSGGGMHLTITKKSCGSRLQVANEVEVE